MEGFSTVVASSKQTSFGSAAGVLISLDAASFEASGDLGSSFSATAVRSRVEGVEPRAAKQERRQPMMTSAVARAILVLRESGESI